MGKNVYNIGFMIFAVIFSIFLVMNIFFRTIDYYKNSIVINSFVLPIIFGAGAYFSVITYRKIKGEIGFKEAYGRAFIPIFVGGLLSFSSIYLYINYLDPNTKDLLNYQYIQSYQTALNEDYAKSKQILKPNSPEIIDLNKKYQSGQSRINDKIKKNEDMFVFKYFMYIFSGYCIFFLLLSLFFGSFFRNKKQI